MKIHSRKEARAIYDRLNYQRSGSRRSQDEVDLARIARNFSAKKIRDEIEGLLDAGRSKPMIIAQGYSSSTVYSVARSMGL